MTRNRSQEAMRQYGVRVLRSYLDPQRFSFTSWTKAAEQGREGSPP